MGGRGIDVAFTLNLLPTTFAICRLDPAAGIPDWAIGTFVSITRTADELSIVCEQASVPQNVRAERDWRCLRVAEKLEFSMVGVISTLTTAFAEAGISVFVVSSFDTDFLLVREADVQQAVKALTESGHTVSA